MKTARERTKSILKDPSCTLFEIEEAQSDLVRVWSKYSDNLEENLACLLYLLMRDHLPTSDVVELVNESKTTKDKRVYTSKQLISYARELVGRLCEIPNEEFKNA